MPELLTSAPEETLLGSPPSKLALRIRGSRRDGQVVQLRSKKVTVGSSPRCTLRLRGKGIAPLHCLILNGSQHTIVRRWSPDTLLNDSSFEDAAFQLGDRLSVGPVELEVVESENSVEPPAMKTDDRATEPTFDQIISQRQDELAESWRQLSTDRESINSLRAKLDEEFAILARQRADIDSQCKATETDRRAWQESVQRQEAASNAEAEAQRQQMAERHAQLSKQLVELHAKESELAEEKTQLTGQRDRLTAAREQLNSDRQQFEGDCNELAARRRAWEVECQAWEAERQKSEAERHKWEADRRTWEAKHDEMTAQHSAWMKQQSDWEAQHGDQHVEIQERQSAANLQNSELEKLRSELADQQAALSAKQQQIEVQHNTLSDQQQLLDRQQQSLAADRETLEKQKQELISRQSQQEDEIQKKSAELERSRQAQAIDDGQRQKDRTDREAALEHSAAVLDQRAAELQNEHQELIRQRAELEHDCQQLAKDREQLERNRQQSRPEPTSRSEPTSATPTLPRKTIIEDSSHSNANEDDMFARLRAMSLLKDETSEPQAEQSTKIRHDKSAELSVEQISDESPVEPIDNELAASAIEPASTSADAPTGGHEDEVSIDDYMARLLQRMRGSDDAPQSAQRNTKSGQEESRKSAGASSESKSQSAKEKSAPPTPLKQLEARKAAPENTSDLAAMREIANHSARSAIATHHHRSRTSRAWSIFAAGITGLIAGGALVCWDPDVSSPLFYLGVAVMLVSSYGILNSGKNAHAISKLKKKLSSAVVEDITLCKSEDAVAGETAVDAVSTES